MLRIDKSQIGRRNLHPEAFKQIVARIYNRTKKAEHDGGKGQSRSGDHFEPHSKTADTVGQQYGLSPATLKRSPRTRARRNMWLACATQDEIAEVVGVSESAVRNWADDFRNLVLQNQDAVFANFTPPHLQRLEQAGQEPGTQKSPPLLTGLASHAPWSSAASGRGFVMHGTVRLIRVHAPGTCRPRGKGLCHDAL